MTTTIMANLVALLGLLCLSAFFSGTEVALFSLSKIQLRRLRHQHPREGQLITRLLEHPHRVLTTILLGNVVVNTGAAILGYALIRSLGVADAEVTATVVMTLALLLFGEVAPKTLMIQHPDTFARWLVRPLQRVIVITRIPRQAAESLSGWIIRTLERLPYFASQRARPTALTEAEYQTLLGVSERAGVLKREERVMVNRILALEELQVREIMTPRVDMQCIEDTQPAVEIVAALRQYKHRRVPVVHETRDNVIGILNAKEYLVDPARPLERVMEPAQIVPETTSVARMLRSFRHQEHPVAVVVDEHGGTAGLVTLEDVLEEIVGEIEDEFDSSEVMVQRLNDGAYLVNGKARLEQVNEQCGVSLQAEDVDTIAGWLLAQTHALPREGQVIRAQNVRVTARKVARNRVREVLLEVRRG